MPIRFLPASGYVAAPWKNGAGTTEEILLLPDGATQAAFEIRASRAYIPRAGPFSAFAGIERTITLIDGEALVLEFGDGEMRLDRWRPRTFDSGLAPMARPVGGPVRVLNVMVQRHRWTLGPATIVTVPTQPVAQGGGMAFGHVLEGEWRAQEQEAVVTLASGDSALVDGDVSLSPIGTGAMLVVPLARTQDRGGQLHPQP
jgi:environmental stress-induced protein Ves